MIKRAIYVYINYIFLVLSISVYALSLFTRFSLITKLKEISWILILLEHSKGIFWDELSIARNTPRKNYPNVWGKWNRTSHTLIHENHSWCSPLICLFIFFQNKASKSSIYFYKPQFVANSQSFSFVPFNVLYHLSVLISKEIAIKTRAITLYPLKNINVYLRVAYSLYNAISVMVNWIDFEKIYAL